jgi:hypothetical protein
MKRWLWMLAVVACAVSVVTAQVADCPASVNEILATLGDNCAAMNRNQACYGNIAIDVTTQDGAPSFEFDSVGDVIDAGAIQTIRLSPYQSVDEWGLALLKLQANIPDSLPGQAVTMLLFGDTEIENRVVSNIEPITVNITANNTINVRSGPDTNNPVVASFAGGTSATAVGRSAGGDWLHIHLEDETAGWVSASLVTVDGDASLLEVMEAEQEAALASDFTPMQAFYLKTGLSETACGSLPGSGLLIQTPEGAGKLQLTVNEVQMTIGSTVFMQSQPDDYMTITTLEGNVEGMVVPGGQFNGLAVIPAGATVRIPTDAEGAANGEPEFVDSSTDTFEGVVAPLAALPEAVEIADPLDVDGVATLLTPEEGTYQFTIQSMETDVCAEYTAPYVGFSARREMTIDAEGNLVDSGQYVYVWHSPGVYRSPSGYGDMYITSRRTMRTITGVKFTREGAVVCDDPNGIQIVEYVKVEE